jgi:hypothetical protein
MMFEDFGSDAQSAGARPVAHHLIVNSAANDVQVGGDHYRLNGKYQIWDLVVDMGWDFFQGNIISYVHRFRLKGGTDDLRKARHYLDKLIEIEEAKKSEGEKS